jgi:hypothetical protein
MSTKIRDTTEKLDHRDLDASKSRNDLFTVTCTMSHRNSLCGIRPRPNVLDVTDQVNSTLQGSTGYISLWQSMMYVEAGA